jgi:N-acyl-L-homoserine lactone synthetase
MKVIIARSEEEKKLSYRLRFDMMCRELGWISTQNYAVPEERDEYDDRQSVPFLAVDDSGDPIGTARLILQGEIPLPIERHFKLYPKEMIEALHGEMECCVEVSRFIVPKNHMFKSHELSLMFYEAIIRECMAMGVTHLLASVDYRVFRLQRLLGCRFEEIGEPKFYMGSKTVPALLSRKTMASILADRKIAPYEQQAADKKTFAQV